MTGMTSDVSDTSFSMFLYVPKKGEDSSKSRGKSSKDDLDGQSYEYKSYDSSHKKTPTKPKKKKLQSKRVVTDMVEKKRPERE